MLLYIPLYLYWQDPGCTLQCEHSELCLRSVNPWFLVEKDFTLTGGTTFSATVAMKRVIPFSRFAATALPGLVWHCWVSLLAWWLFSTCATVASGLAIHHYPVKLTIKEQIQEETEKQRETETNKHIKSKEKSSPVIIQSADYLDWMQKDRHNKWPNHLYALIRNIYYICA